MPTLLKLKWLSASKDNPGHSVWYAHPERDPNVLYVIRQKRKKRDFKPVGWRTFVRSSPDEALRTIYFGETLKECKAFVEDWEEQIAVHQPVPDIEEQT